MVTMKMKIYARVEENIVVEFLATDGDINAMFHRDLVWIDVSDVSGINYGWVYDGCGFSAPSSTEFPTEQIMSAIV
jgi:hypothetical protein